MRFCESFSSAIALILRSSTVYQQTEKNTLVNDEVGMSGRRHVREPGVTVKFPGGSRSQVFADIPRKMRLFAARDAAGSRARPGVREKRS